MMQRRTNTLLHTFRTEGTKAQTSSDVSDVCMHTKSDKQDHRETAWDGVFSVLECNGCRLCQNEVATRIVCGHTTACILSSCARMRNTAQEHVL